LAIARDSGTGAKRAVRRLLTGCLPEPFGGAPYGISGGIALNALALANFDSLPKSKAISNLLHSRTRRLVAPSGAGVARAVDYHIVELDVVGTGTIGFGLWRLLQ